MITVTIGVVAAITGPRASPLGLTARSLVIIMRGVPALDDGRKSAGQLLSVKYCATTCNMLDAPMTSPAVKLDATASIAARAHATGMVQHDAIAAHGAIFGRAPLIRAGAVCQRCTLAALRQLPNETHWHAFLP